MGNNNTKTPYANSLKIPNPNKLKNKKFPLNEIWKSENMQTLRQIDQGTSGYVIEAYNTLTQQKCALKIFEFSRRGDELYKYALLKSAILRNIERLKHPNIIKTLFSEVIEVENNFSLKNKFVIIMDYQESNLKNFIKKQKQNSKYLTEKDLLKALFDLSSALMHAADINIHHNNLKDENVFANEQGTHFFIGDFDIYDTKKIKYVKSLAFLAPEILPKSFDHLNHDMEKCDVYALGIIMIKLALNIQDLEFQDKANIPIFIDDIIQKRECPKLGRILKKMLVIDPKKRLCNQEIFKSVQNIFFEANKTIEFNEYFLSVLQRKIKNLINEGIQYRKNDDTNKALEHFQQADELIHQSSFINICDKLFLATCLHNLAIVYHEHKEYDNALKYHSKALDIRKNHLNHLDTWESYSGISKIYSKLNDYKKSLIYAIKAYSAITRHGPANSIIAAGFLDSIAKSYEMLGDFDNALINYGLCLKAIKKTVGDKNSKYARVLRLMAKLCQRMGLNDTASEFEFYSRKIGY